MALIEKLNAIGDAIRQKNGTTELIPLADMPQAILNISGGGTEEVYTPLVKRADYFFEQHEEVRELCFANVDAVCDVDAVFKEGTVLKITIGDIIDSVCTVKIVQDCLVCGNAYLASNLVDDTGEPFLIANDGGYLCVYYRASEGTYPVEISFEVAESSDAGTEALEKLIDESGVLDSTDGTVTEKLEQLVDKASDENLWYGHIAKSKNATQLFRGYSYQRLPRLPALNVETLALYFAYAQIETIDFYIDIATTNNIAMNNAFAACPHLVSMVGINTLKGINLSSMFTDCYALETIEEPLDFSNATNVSNIFTKCNKLKNISFVKETIKLSISFVHCNMLSADSINSIINGLATVTTAQTLTLNSAITLTDEQKATINAKGWTLAQ